ncbi:hypothetical protein TIFTF001_042625 [Ficus carica]|nr:hypothetical protein TIFTF001_042622 [Ficus carica]GMN37341.1 hypothetical protein TIFTF001_042625 [Ficus carica]
MELRLLYGVAYGHSWFGKCSYSFGHGGFGINESHYRKALGALSTLNLDGFIDDFKETEQATSISLISTENGVLGSLIRSATFCVICLQSKAQ